MPDPGASDLLRPGWRAGWWIAGGLRLHVVEAGPEDGPPLILLHGFPEFWWAWRHQIAPLAARGFRVVVPDLRGYGLSDAPQGLPAYRLDVLVEDVTGLADALGAARFDLAGHDWGGVIAWAVAARHPDRIRRLVILDAPHPDIPARRALRHPTQALRSSYVALFQLPRLPEALLRARGFAALRALMQGTARPGAFAPGDLDRYAEGWARPGRLTAMLGYYRALRHRKRPPQPGRIAPPTLVLWGERDGFLGHHLARAALDLCDDGRLVVLGGTTHWLHLEAPARVTAEIAGFLEGPSPGPQAGPRR